MKELQCLPEKEQKMILEKMTAILSAHPFPVGGNPKRLKGERSFRLRVGDYRILYTIEKEVVCIYAILHRKDAYILVQQMLAKDTYGATAFRVFAGGRTRFTHLQPNEHKSWASLPQESGALSAVKKGSYVYISTEDPLITTPAIRATTIVYTEVSPFPQEIQKK